jgi:uncharacterized protein YkwD
MPLAVEGPLPRCARRPSASAPAPRSALVRQRPPRTRTRVCSAPPAVRGPATETLSPLDQASAERTVLCLTNYAGTRSGLEPLRANPRLAQAGQAKLAADLACGEFRHAPWGKPFRSDFAAYLSGASSIQISENIAWGRGNYGTPRQTMNSWLHSATARTSLRLVSANSGSAINRTRPSRATRTQHSGRRNSAHASRRGGQRR